MTFILTPLATPLSAALGALLAVGSALALGFLGAPLWGWLVWGGIILWATHASLFLWVLLAATGVVFIFPSLRRSLLSRAVFRLFKRLKLLPRVSETERAALQAGDLWIDRELFSGHPRLDLLSQQAWPSLTDEEKSFLSGPIEELCECVKDWKTWENRELPPEAWKLIKKERIWGIIIPKQYGGHGFSAYAHSEAILKLSSRSLALGVTAMVPNSLGPAELLIHYGTEEQKNHYLPRLARGEEIPCFALTEPNAGSDAASIEAKGVVFQDQRGELFLRLNWNKRWITLGAISTLIGLAFCLEDPDELLGLGKKPGITCALIPSSTPGVTADRRHDPLGVPFWNSPLQGKNVIVPVSAIIGGPKRAGEGWTMLMECLAAGRGISLPAQSVGALKLVTRVTSAHAMIRKQFNSPIGNFEGVSEPLARIAARTYAMDAARTYACGALNQGIRPPVITAILKQFTTEANRAAINDGMDILAGQGITLGPRNLIAPLYFGAPIAITVEGANILTRTLMIFGQGAMRAHPYALKEVMALEEDDLYAFDEAIWAHGAHLIRNTFRAFLLTVTRGALEVGALPRDPQTRRYWKRLSSASAQFAWLADIFMVSLGGKLRMKEMITGRFADILCEMYVVCATLRRFEAEGSRSEDFPFVEWSALRSLSTIQTAFEDLTSQARFTSSPRFFSRFSGHLLEWIIRGPWRTLLRAYPLSKKPSDEQTASIAKAICTPGVQRDYRIAGGIFISQKPEDRLVEIERAFRLCHVGNALERKLRHPPGLNEAEKQKLAAIEKTRRDCIEVDSFTQEEYLKRSQQERPDSTSTAA